MRVVHVSAWRYVLVWAVLLGLSALTFLLSFLRLGEGEAFVALGIAAVKSVLVVLFFMHLLEQPFGVALVPLTAVVFMALLSGLVAADVATRHTFPRAPLPMAIPAGEERPARGPP